MRGNFIKFVLSKKIRLFIKKFTFLFFILCLIALACFRFFYTHNYQILKNHLQTNIQSFVNFDYLTIGQVEISGHKYINYNQLKKNIDLLLKASKNHQDYLPLLKKITKIIKQDPWVENVVINRQKNKIIDIKISEYQPFAIYIKEGKKYLINKEGKIISQYNQEEFKTHQEFNDLIKLNGVGANLHAKSLFNILSTDKNIASQVYFASYIGQRRWDLLTFDNILIKLPSQNIEKAWEELAKIYQMPGSFIDLKIIDLRVIGKIYLSYDSKTAKELNDL